jgi:transcription antitermination factor NusG
MQSFAAACLIDRPHKTNWVARSPPGYTFVRKEADSSSLLIRVLRLPGVVRFVTSGRELVAAHDTEIETVRAFAQNDAIYEAGSFQRWVSKSGCVALASRPYWEVVISASCY